MLMRVVGAVPLNSYVYTSVTSAHLVVMARGTTKDESNSLKGATEKMLPESREKPSRMVRIPHSLCFVYLKLTPPSARDNDFDVVLIDTAGRMQDNEVSHKL